MKKASIILIICFVLGCAGRNLNTQETTIQNQKENTPLDTNQQNMIFGNIDEAYIGMDKDLEKLSDEAVRSAFEMAVDTLKKDPGHTRANIVLFNAHVYKSNQKQVLEQYKKLIALKPETSASCVELGSLFARLGKISEAIVFFERSVELDPNFVEGYYNLGRALTLNRQLDQAITAYNKNIKLDPKHYRAWNNLGWIYMIQKDYEPAEKHFNKALEIKPDYDVAHSNLGNLSLLQQDYALAVKQFKQYIDLKPDDPEGYRKLASAYQNNQQLDDAITTFRELLKHKPDDYVAMNNLAILLLSQARFGESVRLLTDVYNARHVNKKLKNEVKKALALASFQLAETLATHIDKKQQAIKAYEDYLKYSNHLSEARTQQVQEKISALQ